jgi:site-specific recombinase XerD
MRNKKDSLGNILFPWVKDFVASIPHIAGKTRKTYQRYIMDFVHYLEDSSTQKMSFPTTIKEQTITNWLNESKKHFSLRTINVRIVPIGNFVSFLKQNKVIGNNPFESMLRKYPRKGLRGIAEAVTGVSPQKSLKALKASPRFASPLGLHMRKFITHERSLGKKYEHEEGMLCMFDRFLSSYSPPPKQLSDSIITAWLASFCKTTPVYRYANFLLVRKFCIYLRRLDPEAYVPNSLMDSSQSTFVPHIYSRTEISLLLRATLQLKRSIYCPLRPEMLHILILLLYTAGLRISEALKLRLCDIDWKECLLHIRETKFLKSRLVPLSYSMMQQLKHYVQLCQQSNIATNHESPVFQNHRTQQPYSIGLIDDMFQRICRHYKIETAKGSNPRLHDLRHTFAVHRLEDWYHKGEDVQSKLGMLSTYMGHTSISGTQKYLTMTTELLQQASRRFNQYFIQH